MPSQYHPWREGYRLIKPRPNPGWQLHRLEYHVEHSPYDEGLPCTGYEQGYSLPHKTDRGAPHAR